MRDDLRRLAAGIAVLLSTLAIVFLSLAIAHRSPQGVVGVEREAIVDAGVARTTPDDASTQLEHAPPDAGPYALDDLPREGAFVVAGCPEVPLIDRAGDPIPWRPSLRIHPAFEPAVQALERAIVETAITTYNVAPVRILSASSYRCTNIRTIPGRVSEHALGNAIDVRGIVLVDGTEVTVEDHWNATGDDEIHARFWRALAQRVIDRAIFRGVIGPPTEDHHDHLHFDLGRSHFHAIDLDTPPAIP